MRYFTSMNPAKSNTKKIVVRIPKFFSMKMRILSPKYHSSPATKKNLKPLDKAEATVKTITSILVTPLAIVTSLYGKKVNPAPATIQAPH